MSARKMAAAAFAATTLAAFPAAAADLDYPDYSYSERERYSERVTHSRDRGDYYEDRAGCLPRHAIRQRLRDDGWRDINRIDVRGGYVTLQAERPNGRVFDLKVDRCNGDIVDSRTTREGVYGEYRERDRNQYRY